MEEYIVSLDEQKQIAELQEDIRRLKRLLLNTSDLEQSRAILRQIDWDINAIKNIIGY